MKGGVIMAQGEKESDGKLYRAYHKTGNHQNKKIIRITSENRVAGKFVFSRHALLHALL